MKENFKFLVAGKIAMFKKEDEIIKGENGCENQLRVYPWKEGIFISKFTKPDGSVVLLAQIKDGENSTYQEFDIAKQLEVKEASNVYHISYYVDKNNPYSKGVDINAPSMLEALAQFIRDYDKEPIYIVKKNF
jgi:hypothetical protein